MRNSYLYVRAAYEAAKLAVAGLQDFYAKDVSSTVGCIDRVLPAPLRLTAQTTTPVPRAPFALSNTAQLVRRADGAANIGTRQLRS